jgi:hypothetical protein
MVEQKSHKQFCFFERAKTGDCIFCESHLLHSLAVISLCATTRASFVLSTHGQASAVGQAQDPALQSWSTMNDVVADGIIAVCGALLPVQVACHRHNNSQ